ncbi:MAG TPA: PLP-dependent aminotransferase family protein [Actinomycetes bacterium]
MARTAGMPALSPPGPDRSVAARPLARLLGSWRRPGPAYAALADALRLLVLDGRLPLAVRLPGERELAAALGLSRTTVTAAYGRLRDQGYAVSRQGSGTRTRLPAAAEGRPGAAEPAMVLGEDAGPGVIDLAYAAPRAPEGALYAAVAAAVEELPRYLPGHGYEPRGLPVLRAAIAERYTARGLPTRPGQVLVTNGAQHALALLLLLLTGPGDRVLVEHPTYPNALEAVRRAGGRPVPVGLPDEGWDVEALEAAARQTGPRLAYLIADFQNPTGRLMDAATREQVAGLARRAGVPVVVDETLAELSLDDATGPAPVPAFGPARGGRDDGRVLAVGSASKVFWGGLRIGWLRAPEELVDRLVAARPGLDLGTPVLEQIVLARLLADVVPVTATRRTRLRAQRDTLAGALAEALPTWRFDPPPGGLALWVHLDAPVSSALAAVAGRHGLRLAAGPRFGVDGAFERFLRVPYTGPAEDLRDAATRLASAYAEVRGGGRRRARRADEGDATVVA